MRVSFAWLQEFVKLDRPPEELAETLTMGGVEVGHLDDWRGRLRGVVVARLVAVTPHPKAERLRLCTVDTGQGRSRVVCAAANLHPGQAVALGKVGAQLPNGQRVEAAEIRGVLSEGMLCSSAELELGHDAEGVLVLPEGSPLGAPLAELLQYDDVILELDLTPNRADCFSMLGVAREVAALCKLPFAPPQVNVAEEGPPTAGRVAIVLDRPDLCPRYCGRLIEGVVIGPSPLWLQVRLLKAGLRPINAIVDATNYVLLERGQPLHAFDFDLLEEQRIVVRCAAAGERFITLDGVERELQPDMLMIADGRRSIALAGVMGGLNSEVHAGTRNVLLESAYFEPTSIRRTAKRLGMHTEASHRFERGVDPDGTPIACDRAADLMARIAAGRVAQGMVDAYPTPLTKPKVRLRLARLNHVLGTALAGPEARGALERLQLPVRDTAPDEFEVSLPLFRPDLSREIDLIEEVARLHGYENIPTTLPLSPLTAESGPSTRPQERRLRELLLACGLCEAITYSFINAEWLDHLRLTRSDPQARPMPLSNPLSAEFSIMRTMLLPGLLNCLRYNLTRQQSEVRLFEYGAVFLPAEQAGALPVELRHLAVLLSGPRHPLSWASEDIGADFFDIKGILEHVGRGFRLTCLDLAPTEAPFLHPGRALAIRCREEVIGSLGEIHPDTLAAFRIPGAAYVFEMHLRPFFAAASLAPRFAELPRYPASSRDLALIVDEQAPAAEVEASIRRAAPLLVREVTLFDCFKGETIPAGKKSLAFSLTFQAEDRTLTDEMINEQCAAIVRALAAEHQAILRDR